ncbi:unnamed protein product [Paramecium sonneborni]|uniref:Uncharacterized protein n=1 Tax=Paramecium sonneborni TaxID=65129 RepID=A0A8S1QZE5_9CILI|nr:unnamed protein product [Paramecium sonneborni]
MENLIQHLKNLFIQYEVKIDEQEFNNLEGEMNKVLIQHKERSPLKDITNNQRQAEAQLEEYGETIIKQIESVHKQPINKILQEESFSRSPHQIEHNQRLNYHYHSQ